MWKKIGIAVAVVAFINVVVNLPEEKTVSATSTAAPVQAAPTTSSTSAVNDTPMSAAPPVVKQTTYTLTDREKNVMSVLMFNEFEVVITNEPATLENVVNRLAGDYAITSSAALQKEYERNEVAGDKKFRKKLLIVDGKVASIDRGIGENYSIALQGGSNQFVKPRASMADGHTDYLSELEKGENITLACQGNGMLIGSAMLAECEPATAFATTRINNLVEKLDIGKLKAAKDEEMQRFVLLSMSAAALLSDASPCFKDKIDHKKCLADVEKSMKPKKKGAASPVMDVVSSMAMKSGIDVGVMNE